MPCPTPPPSIWPPYPGVDLRLNMQGPSIAQVQQKLNELGASPPLPTNGTFNAATESAVRAFQQANGLPQTGVVNVTTWNTLFNQNPAPNPIAPPPPSIWPPYPGVDLRLNMQGPSIAQVQQKLNELGATPPLATDGIFGAMTESAVRAFQQANGLPQTGVVNITTWNTMFNQNPAPNPIAPPPPSIWPPYPGVDLRLNMQGPSIAQVQQKLNELGATPPLPTNGTFNAATETAVRAFQQANGLPQTGVVNITTWNALFNQSPPPNPLPPPPPSIWPPYPGVDLRLNMQGPSIAQVQQKLNELGASPPLPTNGTFNAATETAVRAFQQANGLPQTGVVNITTWNALFNQSPPPNPLPPPQTIWPPYPGVDLRLNMQGPSISQVQQRLNELGASPPLSTDGIFGPLTDAAVRAFQQANSLPQTGVVNTATWNTLFSRNPNPNPISPPAAVKTIVIDAGHGGTNPGAVAYGRREADDTLRLAKEVQRILLEKGQRVIMTRDGDYDVPLDERSAISNSNNADIFVSIHRDASSNPAANGVSNYIFNTAPSLNVRYAMNVLGDIVDAGVQSNQGVFRENFAVLRNTTAPAMLLEMGFITNPLDNQLFDQNLTAYAAAIAEGVLQSFYGPPYEYMSYTVVQGDTMWSIAQKFGTTQDTIMAINKLSYNWVRVGQVLLIPASNGEA